MPELNRVGDVVLRDPRAMRALADPSRLALHDALRRRGPSNASELASLLDSPPRAVTGHLEALEEVGLVERPAADVASEQATWTVVGRGIFFEVPEDGEGQSAARQLSNAMFLQYVELPRRWVSEHEPRLTLDWARAAGLLNVRLLLTPDELRQLQQALEDALEPYLKRQPAAAPADAAHVRLLTYFMPEPDDDGS